MPCLGPGLGLDAAAARRRRAFFHAAAYRLGGIAPVLAADFARGRHALSGALVAAADILAVSGASKWVLDAAGALTLSPSNTPAYTYRSGRRRLVVEGPTTNLITYPTDLTNAAWDKGNVSVSLSGGWSLVRESVATTYHRVGRSTIALSAGSTCTLSALVRRAGRRYAFFRTSLGAALNNIVFDLDTGVVVATPAAYAASLRQIAADTFLLEATFTALASGTLYLNASPTDPGTGTGSWAGDTGLGIDVRYMQLEVAPRATSLVDGGASAGARIADVVQLTPAAAAVLQGTACSLAWRGRVCSTIAAQPLVGLPSGYALLRSGPAGTALHLDGATASTLALGTVLPGEIGAAIGWDGAGRAGAVNGAAAVSDAVAPDRSRASVFLGGSSGLPAGAALEIDELVAWGARGTGAALTAQARGWA